MFAATPVTRGQFWLTRDDLPESQPDRPKCLGLATGLARAIGARMDGAIPWDCADGFFEAYWRRPEANLDENVRRGIRSGQRQARRRAPGSHGLRDDLAAGRWAERNSDP